MSPLYRFQFFLVFSVTNYNYNFMKIVSNFVLCAETIIILWRLKDASGSCTPVFSWVFKIFLLLLTHCMHHESCLVVENCSELSLLVSEERDFQVTK